ncbi:lytic murein transglycosylase [Paraferrimonas sp. SM1919]|uniref:lytic murein transglycosylase n=1 Tax=Paraferrimonas sp. SM1919 TaxID=2662263 RepID=UPI0013D0EE53|nr:lytic murein transglycosylase [Paraferrimonas sp. SM1919]
MRQILPALSILAASLISKSVLADEALAQCQQKLTQYSQSKGIKTETYSAIINGLSLRPQVVQQDRKQPEFEKTFIDYFEKRVNDYRVQQGRKLLAKHNTLLKQLTKKYGVPGQYIVAFWGLETNFGNFKGNTDTFNALATLACDGRRGEFFSSEFVAALKVKQQTGFARSKFKGSWAGALGHTQFMPSNYLSYGVDGDNDGVVDLFDSEVDALTSAANFLNKLGWQQNFRWGREVNINQSDLTYSGSSHKQPLSYWSEQGITDVFQRAIPKLAQQAQLLMPIGANGPAFLVYDNYHVIMKWNRSQSYALTVGILADRINGAGKLKNIPPKIEPLRTAQLMKLQSKLKSLGYNINGVDGRLGPNTRAAISAYQKDASLLADGYPNQEVFVSLSI